MTPIVLDFESTGLHTGSLPIEVAYSLPDGVKSFFINIFEDKPDAYWDEVAEGIHGISKDKIQEEGISPREAIKTILEDLSGKQVFSDAPYYEGMWMGNLFNLCDEKSPITFDHIAAHSFKIKFGREYSVPMDHTTIMFLNEFDEKKAEYFNFSKSTQHIAENDVKSIIYAYRAMTDT